MLLSSSGKGGLERHFIDLCTGLSRHVEVVAVAPGDMLERLPETVKRYQISEKSSRYNLMERRRLSRLIEAERPAVVHAQANKAAAMLGSLKKRHPQVRFVATIHNRKHNVRMFRAFDRVIGVSRTVADLLPDQDAARVVFNGIQPPSNTKSHETWRPESPPHLLAVGRLVEAKGFDLLIEAMQGVDARLAIVGDGPDRPGLQKKIDQYGLGGKVTLLGHREDVNTLMSESDALVISSRREGFSYVLCEALQLGLPVLATRVPVACEILPKDWLVELEGVDALRRGLMRFIASFPEMDRERRRMHEYACKVLTVDAMVDSTLEVYREPAP